MEQIQVTVGGLMHAAIMTKDYYKHSCLKSILASTGKRVTLNAVRNISEHGLIS